MSRSRHLRSIAMRGRQRGLTLLELMVAMTIALIISLAALAAMLFARDGFSAVDTSSQLRENARFATELISRVVVQAGYQDVSTAPVTSADALKFSLVAITPNIYGFNNALIGTASAPLGTDTSNDNRTSACDSTTTSCANGSDVLVVRFLGMNGAGGTADGSMVNCAGAPQASVTDITQRPISIFHVKRSGSDEPTLMCTSLNASGVWQSQPLVKGVESFQVLYGTDHVTPGTVPGALTQLNSIPDRWLRADQMVVSGNAAATTNNWLRVRAVRIGMLLRSDPTQGQSVQSGTQTFYPFVDTNVANNTNDFGTALVVPGNDRRVRHVLTFTVHLRNAQQ